MSGQCAHMLDDGNCKVAPAKSGGGVVVDARRPEGDIVITASVGQGGANKKDDVFNIQYGLNQVAPVDGGPSPQLKMDGLCGPKTIGAIRDFQMKHFGWQGADGRIDRANRRSRNSTRSGSDGSRRLYRRAWRPTDGC